jgi:hypothetical protein
VELEVVDPHDEHLAAVRPHADVVVVVGGLRAPRQRALVDLAVPEALDEDLRVARVGDVIEVEAARVGVLATFVVDREHVPLERRRVDTEHLRALAVERARKRRDEPDLARVGGIADVDDVDAALRAGRIRPRVQVCEALVHCHVRDLLGHDLAEPDRRLELADDVHVLASGRQVADRRAVLPADVERGREAAPVG